MPTLELSPRERSDLRSAAHPLRPVVLIGDNGLTEAVLKEINLALNSHALIKVRAGGKEREDREATLVTVCEILSCAPVHHLGKILILYRPIPGNVKSIGISANERPKRKASEPYTSKKIAAEGKTTSKTRAVALRRNHDKAANDTYHTIPRRSGSALSLRSSVRGRTTTRKVTKRQKINTAGA